METRQDRLFEIKAPKEILILRGGALGDTLLTLPAIYGIRKQWPDSIITVMCRPSLHAFVKTLGLASECRSIDDRLPARLGISGVELDAPERDFLSRFGLIVSYLHDPDGVIESNLLMNSSAIVVVVDPLPGASHYEQAMFAPLGLSAISELKCEISNEVRRCFLRQAGICATPYISIHPGSGSPKKNWPLRNFIEVARRLSASRGLKTVWLLGEADDELRMALGKNSVDKSSVHYGLPFEEVAALLVHASCYLGNDSGISHLAVLCGTPSVIVFGPSDAFVWGHQSKRVSIVSAGTRAAESLSAVTVDQVLDGVLSALSVEGNGNSDASSRLTVGADCDSIS